jgi:DNA gyrase/topoisomerase IV subunit B
MLNTPTLDLQNITGSVIRALVLYSLAEFQFGHATTIRVTAAGRAFSVADDGRGHAIARTVAEAPYLKFIYTHLDYPFESGQSAPIQLHGIGMSLINVLCSELIVLVRKQAVTLRLLFRAGHLYESEILDVESQDTGNLISGVIGHQFSEGGVDFWQLQQWLLGVLVASPGLKLYFNDRALQAAD